MAENGNIVRSAILAQNGGDDEALLAVLDPAIEWHSEAVGGRQDPVVRGREALRDVLRSAREEVGDVRITMHELHEEDDAVLVVGSIATEKGLHMPRAWIWRLRGGLAIRVDSFLDRDQAMRAWEGLSPDA